MKILITAIISFLIGYFISNQKDVKQETTFSNKGIKTVIATCEKEKDCQTSIGQECENLGFKIINTEFDKKFTVTAECGEPKQFFLGL